MSEQDDEDFAQDTLTQAIENQLEAGEPAFVQAVLNKLTLVGYEREEQEITERFVGYALGFGVLSLLGVMSLAARWP